jgi:hypothetical protein
MAYWFKRRRYGWGFFPVTWQGWTLTAAYVVLVVVPAFVLPDDHGTGLTIGYLAYVVVLTGAFLAITFATGPRPRWRWGSSVDDDPDQDY